MGVEIAHRIKRIVREDFMEEMTFEWRPEGKAGSVWTLAGGASQAEGASTTTEGRAITGVSQGQKVQHARMQ